MSTGIKGLDEVLCGGLPAKRLYLVQGHPGTGKTTLALQFLMAGVAQGERCLYVTLSETEEELQQVAKSHGWSLEGINLYELNTADDLDRTEQHRLRGVGGGAHRDHHPGAEGGDGHPAQPGGLRLAVGDAAAGARPAALPAAGAGAQAVLLHAAGDGALPRRQHHARQRAAAAEHRARRHLAGDVLDRVRRGAPARAGGEDARGPLPRRLPRLPHRA